MAHIKITAAAQGFNIIGGAGQLMAPDAFFAGALADCGTMVSSHDGTGWIWGDNLRQVSFGMQIDAQMPLEAGPQLGSMASVLVSAISYWRMEGDTRVEIGQMVLPQAVQVSAYWQDLGGDTAPVWVADLGTELGHVLASSGVRFIGGAGDDVFSAAADAHYMRGHSYLKGGAGNDHLTGGVGNDTIRGGTGNDLLVDDGGQNLLVGGAGNDVIMLGVRSTGSTAKGGSGDDVLTSSIGSDTLIGGSGHDILNGGGGHDVLMGSGGRDQLFGGSGDDILVGGRGHDILAGDGGADTFVFNSADRGCDIIRDFEDGQDSLEIHGLRGGMDALTIAQNGANAELYWDGRLQVTLENFEAGHLSVDDFAFI